MSQEDRAQRQRRREWRLMELERRQMELAIDNSRRDAFRLDRRVQDEEYERALKEAEEEAQRQQRQEQERMAMASSHSPSAAQEESPHSEQSDLADGIGMASDDAENEAYRMAEQPSLEPLPSEPMDSKECVYIRVRLPNGERIERRFHYSATVGDIVLWTSHECVKHNQAHLVGHSQLISTMPHTEYDDMDADMKALHFWRPNAKRKLVSPLLYVEEL